MVSTLSVSKRDKNIACKLRFTIYIDGSPKVDTVLTYQLLKYLAITFYLLITLLLVVMFADLGAFLSLLIICLMSCYDLKENDWSCFNKCR